MATLAQTKGSVKDVQGVLGHSRPDITPTIYMQQIESGVRQTLDGIYNFAANFADEEIENTGPRIYGASRTKNTGPADRD